jgi:hypothetical protein
MVHALLAAVKTDDAAVVRALVRVSSVRAAYADDAPPCVNPLHEGILELRCAAVEALLSPLSATEASPFHPAMRGFVDMSQHGDGLGDVRRALRAGPITALDVLETRLNHYVRACACVRVRVCAHACVLITTY